MADQDASGWTVATLKAYFEAILEEQRLAIRTADEEREKSAQIVRESLTHMVEAADAALAQHIRDQVVLIRQVVDLNHHAVEAAFAASEKAILKAEVAAEKRFESVNEFRAQLSDQTKTFLPRETFDAFVRGIDEYKESTNRALLLREGLTKGADKTVGYVFAAVGLLGTIIAIFLVIGDVLTP